MASPCARQLSAAENARMVARTRQGRVSHFGGVSGMEAISRRGARPSRRSARAAIGGREDYAAAISAPAFGGPRARDSHMVATVGLIGHLSGTME